MPMLANAGANELLRPWSNGKGWNATEQRKRKQLVLVLLDEEKVYIGSIMKCCLCIHIQMQTLYGITEQIRILFLSSSSSSAALHFLQSLT